MASALSKRLYCALRGLRDSIQMLLLTPPPEQWEGKPSTVVSFWAGPKIVAVEQAGRSHLEKCACAVSVQTESRPQDQGDEQTSPSPKSQFLCDVDAVSSVPLDDFYGLLGISHLSCLATMDDIKKAYRTVSLVYHPDKNALEDIEKSEQVFKAIGDAYTTLTDEKKRRTYDSTLPFNDDIPEANQEFASFQEFWEEFGPVFADNMRFSIRKKAPVIGDEASPITQVNRFYDFWFSFKSWREFKVEDEYELDESSTREERRWVERQNQKLQASAKKKESQRVRLLVERAIASDPRVLAYQKAQREEKEAKKRQREEEKRRIQEEALMKEEALRAEREAAEKAAEEAKENARLQRQQEKKKLKNIRRSLRDLTGEISFDDEDIKTLTSNMKIPQLEELVLNLQDETVHVETLKEMVLNIKGGKEAHSAPAEETLESWSKDELSSLAKAVAKFPGGTIDRWEKIANFVGTKSLSQTMKMAKEIKKANRKNLSLPQQGENVIPAENLEGFSSLGPATPTSEWTPEQQKLLELALKEVPKDHSRRWDEIADRVPGKSRKECVRRFKSIREALLRK